MQETSQPASEIPFKAELIRKSLHLLALVIPISLLYLGKYTSLLLLVPLCFLAIFLEFARVRSQVIAHLVERVFGMMMRPKERPEMGAPVVINGATWILLSATLLAFMFPIKIAAGSMIMFMISDAAAALVGRRFGRIKWGSSSKTVEGSFAFFVAAVSSLIFFNMLSVPACLFVAFFAMVLELIPVPLNDNLYVPLGSAGVIFLLLKFVYGLDVVLFF